MLEFEPAWRAGGKVEKTVPVVPWKLGKRENDEYDTNEKRLEYLRTNHDKYFVPGGKTPLDHSKNLESWGLFLNQARWPVKGDSVFYSMDGWSGHQKGVVTGINKTIYTIRLDSPKKYWKTILYPGESNWSLSKPLPSNAAQCVKTETGSRRTKRKGPHKMAMGLVMLGLVCVITGTSAAPEAINEWSKFEQ